MTVEELLSIKKFRKLKVINEKADLTRVVETIESTEAPDVVSFVPKHTLLITTGMAYENDQRGLYELIIALNEQPCAALAIKIGRFIDELSPQVLQIANDLRVPIIQIPMDMTLGDVYHQFLACLWDDKNEELMHALNTQKVFSNLILHGSSTKVMLNNLGNILDKEVAILDPFGEVLEMNTRCSTDHKDAACKLFFDLKLFKQDAEAVNDFLDREHGKQKVSIHPIKIVGRNSYYLFIFDSEDLSSGTTTLIVEQMLLIMGIVLYKNLYVLYDDIRSKEDFLHILVERKTETQWTSQQLLALGEKYGVKQSSYYSITLGTIESFGGRKFDISKISFREEKYILIFQWLEQYVLREFTGNIVVFPEIKNFKFVFLIHDGIKISKEKIIYIHDLIWQMTQVDICFSQGNTMLEIESVSFSYNEAVESYYEGEVRDDLQFFKHYKPKQASQLLKSIPGDQVEKYCIHILKSLAYPNDEMTIELQKTLKMFLECNGSVTETANLMYLHRNTIKYRIKKCKEILDCDFSDPDQYFQILLSLNLAADRNS